MTPVDLRSDTVTRPTPAMRRAIAEATVGDDVFGDDPTVQALQERAAALLGKDAALFVPSGTMANQIAIRTHTEPGDEIILEASCHIFLYEGGGASALSGVSTWCVQGDRGRMAVAQIEAAVRPAGGLSHFPRTRLVCVENTANRAGGTVYDLAELDRIGAFAASAGLALHLDGARLFNAATALAVPVARIAAPFDSVSICLSKGLGCPVGSLLVGSRPFIDRAHRFRKMFGGGMRQAGVLAAAGLYALDHHVARLADDHARAARLADFVGALDGFGVDRAAVMSNMVYVDTVAPAADVVAGLAEAGVLCTATAPAQLRLVTHLDVDDAGIDRTLAAFAAMAG